VPNISANIVTELDVFLGRGYIEARTDTTQQSGQTPNKEVEIKNITVYVNGYTETPDSLGR
jgi:DNA-binding sugar fermentation-stimulating protein